ncbi:sulfotransferase [Psychromonas sp. GE-S-Ul-11]|uniref:sulfotransferase n=1 Tax=Psychromonas sp. GE-S-Ul-11 TaxID=3241170 RepID=UPI00390CA9F8
MEKPQFVIGIGSQRAGSTLLHRILDECTNIFMHPVKELHYFDTLYNVRHQDVLTKYSRKQVDRELERIISTNEHGYLKSKKYKCYLRANKLLANQAIKNIDYLDLYRPCLMGNEKVGEITPEYMILPEEGVKQLAKAVGKESKIILIARNPTERFLSAFKLLKVYNGEGFEPETFEKMLVETMADSKEWMKQQDSLNDYQNMLKNYKKYFSNVLFLSYDNIVSQGDKTHLELEEFLGTPVDKTKYLQMLTKKVNAIGETGIVSSETRNILNKRYELQIAFLNSYFGKENCVL